MEDKSTNKSIKVWIASNRNGFLVLFKDKPTRNESTGKWEGTMYSNSVIYKMVKDLMDKVSYNWFNEPEYFEFQYN